MVRRRYRAIAAVAAGLLACCLLLSLWVVARHRDAAAPSRPVSALLLEPRRHPAAPGAARPGGVPALVSLATPLAACERRIEHRAGRLPAVAIVGASYTAGTGPGNPELSWSVALARLLRWNAVIYGVPGAGYVRTSASGRGPMTRMLGQEGLRRLRPALVIVQAGYDDLGVPAALEWRRVAATVRSIRAAAPRARIALITTFAVSAEGTPALRRTDRTIVAAGKAADPGVIIMDPLAGRWTFPRAGGHGLHPTAAGDEWIARTAAAALRARGVRPAWRVPAAPMICDASVGVGRQAHAAATTGRAVGRPVRPATPGSE